MTHQYRVGTVHDLRADRDPSTPPAHTELLDLELVAEILRRAGFDCQVDARPAPTMRACKKGYGRPLWTVTAGFTTAETTSDGAGTSVAFVRPMYSARTRLLHNPDERQLAAVVVLQALRTDPNELLTYDEAAAAGLADDLVWV